jgi:hypothetical protein
LDELTIAGVLLALFALVILVESRAWRRAYLEHLPALEGERTLFEERGITADTVPQVGRGTRFPNSPLRLTDRRLVLAQPVLDLYLEHAREPNFREVAQLRVVALRGALWRAKLAALLPADEIDQLLALGQLET